MSNIVESQYIGTIYPNDGTGSPSNINFYPNVPKFITLAYNRVVNIDGQQIRGFKWELLTEHDWPGYTVYQLKSSDDDEVIRDLGVIKEYLVHMTGSDYIPYYDNQNPNASFIYLTDPHIEREVDRAWKFQYESDYGLLTFRVDNFPFASKKWVEEYITQALQGLNN